jgi:hypothetical protein
MKRGTVVLVIMAAVWLLLLGAPGQAAAQFLGQSTWTVSIAQDEKGPVSNKSFTMTGAVTRLGGTYYAMQGYVILPDDGPFMLAGGGVLIGEALFLTLTTSQLHTDSPWRDTGVMQVQLNKTTLSGTFYEVGHDFRADSSGPSPVFDSRFTAGTVTLAGPPIPLSSSLTGPTSLLLTD